MTSKGDEPDFTDDDIAALEAAADGAGAEPLNPQQLTQAQIDALGKSLVQNLMAEWKKHQAEIGTHGK